MSSDTPGKLFFKNAGITALFLLLATAVAYLFFRISNNTTNVVILYSGNKCTIYNFFNRT